MSQDSERNLLPDYLESQESSEAICWSIGKSTRKRWEEERYKRQPELTHFV